jgi:hypothetical protein
VKAPEPDIVRAEESPFVRFAKVMRALVAVPKKELQNKLMVAKPVKGKEPRGRD